MSRIFEMASGQIESSLANKVEPTLATCPPYAPNELALRLLTFAESEEQQTIPRPRPWLFK